MNNKLIAKGITTDLNSYTFNGIKDEPIIVITEDGFKYKGELIEDKGEIYQLFKNYLTFFQNENMYTEQQVLEIIKMSRQTKEVDGIRFPIPKYTEQEIIDSKGNATSDFDKPFMDFAKQYFKPKKD